jgi:acetylornithine deacetylase/succinyl-diaminopimelate desuccinylase-like protein
MGSRASAAAAQLRAEARLLHVSEPNDACTRRPKRAFPREQGAPMPQVHSEPRTKEPLAKIVRKLMPELKADLARLIRIPSVAFPGFPQEPVLQAHDAVVALLKGVGVSKIEKLVLPDVAPVIIADLPGPKGAPTVLLYSHYDVVPLGEESDWETPAFEAVEKDGAIFGRGTADAKGNLIALIGALRAWNGKPPVSIRFVIEGQEEFGSPFAVYPAKHPELFKSDAMVIADMGNVRPGEPTLTVSLRGSAAVTLEVRTLSGPKHSGSYGGAAPDALLVLMHALASLHDEKGDVRVAGLRREEWTGASYTEEEFRALAEVEPGLPFIGTGELGDRVWSGPAITITGIDAPSVEKAMNAVNAFARAKLNLRVHPGQSVAEAQAAVMQHLKAVRPFGVALKVTAGDAGQGFSATDGGPAYEAARSALRKAWGRETSSMAGGGSIPLVSSLQEAVPDAEILLFGASDGYANIHAPNERVLVDELERATVAIAEFFGEYAARGQRAASRS